MHFYSLSKGGNWPRTEASGRRREIIPTSADAAANIHSYCNSEKHLNCRATLRVAMSSCLTHRKIPVERAAYFPCVQSSLNPPLKKSNTPSSECMAGDEMSLSGNLSERSLAYNYGRITGPLLLWQMIEGDLINLQIDIDRKSVV